MDKITGAIFDMDGTLTDSMFIWNACFDEALSRFFGTTRDQMDRQIVEKLDTAPISMGVPLLCEYFSSPIDQQEILDMMKDYMQDFYSNKVELKAGALELLEHLSKKGIPMCVASASSPMFVHAALKHCGIDHYFKKILTCDEIGKSKEYPDIYELSLSVLSSPRESTWIFEDAVIAMRTASRVGMKVAGVYDAAQKEQEEIKSLSTVYVSKEENLFKLVDYFA